MAVRSCAELGVPDGIIDVVRQARGGLLLVAGERGTGRSEVLASMIHEAAAQSGRYVWVLDEATEYPLPETGAMVVRRQTRNGGRSAVTALRAALREDPDVIVIGDAGSPQLLELALRGAEGGRLVIAGLHATQAIGSIQGVLDYFNEFEVGRVRAVLAATLHGVLVRRLLPDVQHRTMLPATEVLLPDAAARDIIRGGDLQHLDLLMRMPDGRCGHRIDQSLLEILANGQAAFEDVFACAEEKAWVLERAAVSGSGAGGATSAGNKEQKG
jgi:twitching motility protein PilT